MTETEERLKQIELLLEQEKGKNIALSREISEVKRQAKITEDQAAALKAETEASLVEAADQMKIALAVSQGIWALGHLGRAYLARKIAAARVVHREQQLTLLMERMITNMGKDPQALQAAVDQAQHVIAVIRKDGELTRVQAAETMITCGLKELEKSYDAIVSKDNSY